jgi:fructose-1,6-bisphosphatase/inositol monophosphatase family enzyme
LSVSLSHPVCQPSFYDSFTPGVYHTRGATDRLGAYFEAGLKPWDIAAASLIITEAKGQIIDPYDINNSFSIFKQKSILVGSPIIV